MLGRAFDWLRYDASGRLFSTQVAERMSEWGGGLAPLVDTRCDATLPARQDFDLRLADLRTALGSQTCGPPRVSPAYLEARAVGASECATVRLT